MELKVSKKGKLSKYLAISIILNGIERKGRRGSSKSITVLRIILNGIERTALDDGNESVIWSG